MTRRTNSPPILRLVGRMALAALLPMALAGCGTEDPGNTYAPPPPPSVDVATPLAKEVTRELVYTGQVVPRASVELSARVQGFLTGMNFTEGERVKEGDLLFTIDDRQYRAAVDRAKAQIDATKASLEGAESDAKLAEELAAQNAGPRIDAVTKRARRDALAAQLESDKAALESAKLELEYCQVRAPLSGRVTDAKVDVGNLVGRGETTLLATIVDTGVVQVNVDVSEADVLMVREVISGGGKDRATGSTGQDPAPAGQGSGPSGRKVFLTLPGSEARRFEGAVDYVSPQLDQQTGTLRVRCAFENGDETLLPGLFVTVRFPIDTYRTLLIPDAALLADQEGRFALVLDPDDTVRARRVQVGERRGSLREVKEGIAPEDRVVVLGVLKARPGSKVAPNKVEVKDSLTAP